MQSIITDNDSKLVAMECNAFMVEQLQCTVSETKSAADKPPKQSAALQTRHDEAEDQSRRDNLLFFVVTDAISETWAETEDRIVTVLQWSLNMQVACDALFMPIDLKDSATKRATLSS